MTMKQGDDQNWLLGNPLWWPNLDSSQRLLMVNEEIPPDSWLYTTPDVGGSGWMRQRIQPVGPRILFTTSWSLFFLISTIIPLIFPNKLPIDDQNLAISLFLFSWILLILPFFWFSNANNETFRLFPLEPITLLLGLIFFLLHIAINPKLGWISYIFFLYAWFQTVRNISASLSVNSARWLLPIASSSFSTDIFNDEWTISTKNFRNGLIATSSMNLSPYSAELTGVTRGDDRFIAFSMVYRGCIMHDPFNKNFVKTVQISNFLNQPPMNLNGEEWPSHFILIAEDE